MAATSDVVVVLVADGESLWKREQSEGVLGYYSFPDHE